MTRVPNGLRPVSALACLAMLVCAPPAVPAKATRAPATSAPARAAADTSVAGLVARMIDAFGGRTSIERVHAYRMHGTVAAAGHSSRSGPTVRVFQWPDRLKVVIDYPDAPETRIVKGRQGWRSSGGPVEEARSPMLDAMVLQASRAGLPWVLTTRGAEARRAPAHDLDGRPLQGVELPVGDALAFRAWADSTGRIRITQGEFIRGDMRTQFETIYDDWRPVSGLWFAHREENYAAGMQTSTTVFDSVIVDPSLRPDEFTPPISGTPARPDSS
jgi:hypothetical protein